MEKVEVCAADIWRIAAGRLKERNEPSYCQWFKNMTPLAIDDSGSVLSLGIPDDFFGSIVSDQYDDLLREALMNINGVDFSYRFESGYEPPVDKEVKTVPEPPAVTSTTEIPPRPMRPRRNPHDYTFDNFVVCDANKHAFAAARAAVEEPGLYNPLFLYGTNGVGKTHLLQAVAAGVRASHPGAVIRSTTSAELINTFYDLLNQKQSLSSFRSLMQDVDVLLIDDIHSLAKKYQLQEDFFHLFNTLYSRNRQIVFTSDRQPCEIHDIDTRLTTRFESGMISEICMPEYEARLVILRMWRKEMLTDSPLPDEFLEFLASNIASSVRRLKGAFMRLSVHASMSGNNRFTLEDAEALLQAQLAQESAARDISIEQIQRTVAGAFGVSIADLLGKKRTRNIAEPRMVAMYLARELTSRSSNEIGEAFARDHATILHAGKQVPRLCGTDENFRRTVAQIKRQLQRG